MSALAIRGDGIPMGGTSRTAVGTVVAFAAALLLSGQALGETVTVSGTSYTNTTVLELEDPTDTYRVTKPAGKQIVYTMTVLTAAPACAEVYLIQGHSVGATFSAYALYSLQGCGRSFTTTFSPDSEGTAFTILVQQGPADDNVQYRLDVRIEDQPFWANNLIMGALCFVIFLVVVIALAVARSRRRAAQAAAPPMMPPGMPPAGPPAPGVPGQPQVPAAPPQGPPPPPAQ